MKRYFVILFLVLLIAPSTTLASWWKPTTWFYDWTFSKPYDINKILENRGDLPIKKPENNTSKPTSSTTKKTVTNTATTTKNKSVQNTGTAPVNSPTNTQKLKNPNNVVSVNSTTPLELVGLWRYAGYYDAPIAPDTNWKKIETFGVPINLRYRLFRTTDMCTYYYIEPEGLSEGVNCISYAKFKTSNDDITLPSNLGISLNTDNTNQLAQTVNISIPVTISTISLTDVKFLTPTKWKVTNNQLELYVTDQLTNKIIKKYIYTKIIPPPPPELSVRINKSSINPGEDLIISGNVSTSEPVRIYIKIKGKEKRNGTFPMLYEQQDLCNLTRCNSPFIVDTGTNIELIPYQLNTNQKSSSEPDFIRQQYSLASKAFEQGKYSDCPWAANIYGEGYVTVHVICIQPSSNGDFSVRIFNPGIDIQIGKNKTATREYILYVKTTRSLVEKRLEYSFVREGAICRDPNKGFDNSPITCPPYWNQKKRS